MDKNKNARGQQNQGQQNQGQQGQGSKDRNWNDSKDRNWNDTSQSNTNRESPAAGRDPNADNRGNMGGPERGTGSQGEKNSSGISNRGMDRSEEQADLPSRGSSDEDWSDSSDENWSDRSDR
jgi:hypothetical protein